MALIPINIKVSEDADFYITAEDDAHIYSRIVPDGVISSVGNECRVVVSGNDFVISSGLICIQGYFLRVSDNHRVRKIENVSNQYLKAKITLGDSEDTWSIFASNTKSVSSADLFKGSKTKELLIASLENGVVKMENRVEALPEFYERLKVAIEKETERVQNESRRVEAENTRLQKENERNTAENTRLQKERERQTAENTRLQKETERNTAENTRNTKERERNTAESTRQNKERERQSAENTRLQKENERQTAEEQRKTWFDNTKRILNDNPVGSLTNEFNEFKEQIETGLGFITNAVVKDVTLNESSNTLVVSKGDTNTSLNLPRGFSGSYNDLTNKPTNLVTTTQLDTKMDKIIGLSSKDLNTIFEVGFYSCSSCSNKPSSSGSYGSLIVLKADNNRTSNATTDTVQIYIDNSSKIFVRDCIDKNNSWDSWNELVTTSVTGNVLNLRTNNKNSLVDAINEVFQLGTSKAEVIKSKVSALIDKSFSNLGSLATELEKYETAFSFNLLRNFSLNSSNIYFTGRFFIVMGSNIEVFDILKNTFYSSDFPDGSINYSNENLLFNFDSSYLKVYDLSSKIKKVTYNSSNGLSNVNYLRYATYRTASDVFIVSNRGFYDVKKERYTAFNVTLKEVSVVGNKNYFCGIIDNRDGKVAVFNNKMSKVREFSVGGNIERMYMFNDNTIAVTVGSHLKFYSISGTSLRTRSFRSVLNETYELRQGMLKEVKSHDYIYFIDESPVGTFKTGVDLKRINSGGNVETVIENFDLQGLKFFEEAKIFYDDSSSSSSFNPFGSGGSIHSFYTLDRILRKVR